MVSKSSKTLNLKTTSQEADDIINIRSDATFALTCAKPSYLQHSTLLCKCLLMLEIDHQEGSPA
jgi:hypothetical protein